MVVEVVLVGVVRVVAEVLVEVLMLVVVVLGPLVVVVLGAVVVVGVGTVVVVGVGQRLGGEVAFVMTSWRVFVLLLPQPFSVMVAVPLIVSLPTSNCPRSLTFDFLSPGP